MKYAGGHFSRRCGWREVEDVPADCKVRETAEQQRSASPSQAALVAPSIGVPTQAARAAGAGTADLEHMNSMDLHKLSVALGIVTYEQFALHVVSCLCCSELLRLTASNRYIKALRLERGLLTMRVCNLSSARLCQHFIDWVRQ